MAVDCTALLMAAECRGSGTMVRTISLSVSLSLSLARALALSLFITVGPLMRVLVPGYFE